MSEQPVAVVTGAAGGMGRVISHRLAEDGWTVVLGDISDDGLAELGHELADKGFACAPRHADVTVESDVEELADLAQERGLIGTWVNAAGAIHRAPLLELTLEQWDQMMVVNARSCFLGVRAAARRMRVRGGSITNLASISSVTSLPDTAHYGASKGAVASLTRHAALELGPLGIRVNAIAPGTILTPMTADRLVVPEQRNRTLGRIPLGRLGGPQDVAGLVAFLARDEASYISGATIHVDGGWYASC